jgi:hypothetical protein
MSLITRGLGTPLLVTGGLGKVRVVNFVFETCTITIKTLPTGGWILTVIRPTVSIVTLGYARVAVSTVARSAPAIITTAPRAKINLKTEPCTCH